MFQLDFSENGLIKSAYKPLPKIENHTPSLSTTAVMFDLLGKTSKQPKRAIMTIRKNKEVAQLVSYDSIEEALNPFGLIRRI